MDDEVIEFIRRRFPRDTEFMSGNCYWFAVILTMRFWRMSIWYLPIMNHFVVSEDGETFYDWEGKKTREDIGEVPYLWGDYYKVDEFAYERIVRDCIK